MWFDQIFSLRLLAAGRPAGALGGGEVPLLL
jgi:hypothetical protein